MFLVKAVDCSSSCAPPIVVCEAPFCEGVELWAGDMGEVERVRDEGVDDEQEEEERADESDLGGWVKRGEVRGPVVEHFDDDIYTKLKHFTRYDLWPIL